MPKHEAGSPKDIANRAKARGLQKLKFWCAMCQKQCRDENGFKCHCASESHIRQLALFSQNAEGFMDEFSQKFDKAFMELLSRRFGTRRVAANYVYNEYIQDKLHVHMNSTMWTTLSDYVAYLGRTGKATIEETERGWFLTFIDRDPEAARRADAAARQRERDGAEGVRFEEEVELRAAAAAAATSASLTAGAGGALSHSLEITGGEGAAGAARLGVRLGLTKTHARAAALSLSAALDADESSSEGGDGGGGTTTAERRLP